MSSKNLQKQIDTISRKYDTLLDKLQIATRDELFWTRRYKPNSTNMKKLKNATEHKTMVKTLLNNVRNKRDDLYRTLRKTVKKEKKERARKTKEASTNDPQAQSDSPASGGRRGKTRKNKKNANQKLL